MKINFSLTLLLFLVMSSCNKETIREPKNASDELYFSTPAYDKTVTIDIPAGALTATDIIGAKYFPAYHNTKYARHCYEAAYLFSNQPTLQKEAEVTIYYEMCDEPYCDLYHSMVKPYLIRLNAAAQPEVSLQDSTLWEPIPVYVVDSVKKTITFHTKELNVMYTAGRELL